MEVNGNSLEYEERITGTVMHWKHDFGFIRADDPELPDIFIHYNDIITSNPDNFKQLLKGDKVKFNIKKVKRKGKDGYHAVNCSVILKQGSTDGRRKERRHYHQARA